ncbi:MAG: hypothetical protein AMXMBFR80_17730 [Dehalococcoidia bacterium]|jgi:hypothetical protein|nr:DUF6295 family protein [Tepidiformaceae bacterium]
MCTNIVEHAVLTGSGKGASGWFTVAGAHVTYDHPFHIDLEHALNIDFTNDAGGVDARVAVELTLDSAKSLANAILAAVERAERYEAGG